MLQCWMLTSVVGPPNQNFQMVTCSAVVYIVLVVLLVLLVLVVSACSTSSKCL